MRILQGSGFEAYEAVLAEHQELRLLLAKIDEALAQRTATYDAVVEMLGLLGDRLVKHFAMEEHGGYFAEALSHAPQLISKANRLLEQHPAMRAKTQGLVVKIEPCQTAGEDWWNQTAERFRAFREELLKHESRENALLQEAYTRDLGAKD